MSSHKIGLTMLGGALAVLAIGCGPVATHAADEPTAEQSLALGAGNFAEVPGFGTNPGGLKMYLYTPSPEPAAGAPVVLALHACTQNASAYRHAGWEPFADQSGFWVVYPEQQSINNAMGCFNWAGEYGDPTNLKRGLGENQSIKEMVDTMISSHGADPARVFVMGHSGGGAEAVLMMAVWPDLFAAGGTIAGIPFNCTTTFSEVTSCLNPGKDLTPEQWGQFVRDAYPGYAGPYPRVSVWQGANDLVVNPMNADQMIDQWTNVHAIGETPIEDTVDGATHRQYQDGSGVTQVEDYRVPGAGHGTFVDPEKGCGDTGSYLIDFDICAVSHLGQFFGVIGAAGGAGGESGVGGAAAGGGTSGGGATTGNGGGSSGSSNVGGSSGSGTSTCVPGRQVICKCPGGEGIQTCNADGKSYGRCSCGLKQPSGCAIAGPARRSTPSDSASGGALGTFGIFGMFAMLLWRRVRRLRGSPHERGVT